MLGCTCGRHVAGCQLVAALPEAAHTLGDRLAASCCWTFDERKRRHGRRELNLQPYGICGGARQGGRHGTGAALHRLRCCCGTVIGS